MAVKESVLDMQLKIAVAKVGLPETWLNPSCEMDLPGDLIR